MHVLSITFYTLKIDNATQRCELDFYPKGGYIAKLIMCENFKNICFNCGSHGHLWIECENIVGYRSNIKSLNEVGALAERLNLNVKKYMTIKDNMEKNGSAFDNSKEKLDEKKGKQTSRGGNSARRKSNYSKKGKGQSLHKKQMGQFTLQSRNMIEENVQDNIILAYEILLAIMKSLNGKKYMTSEDDLERVLAGLFEGSHGFGKDVKSQSLDKFHNVHLDFYAWEALHKCLDCKME
ncbi:hypothetical protein HPP92_010528 [Vanilla planifolia]|uniref:CCHC-type domain-containing protein n=1 Tax=Vanilla planifolia TaxID=51239 RepID=A0A835R5B1_VANPL|nr:hypothetical protein HPP92_010528 [Vanilla planifolia]